MVLHSLLVSYSLKNVKALSSDEDIDANNSGIRFKNESVSQAFVAAKATESTPGSALVNFLAYSTLLVLFASSTFSGITREQYGTEEATTVTLNKIG